MAPTAPVTSPGAPVAPAVGEYRWGNHNPRNIYRVGLDRDTDEQVAVAFAPELGKLIVEALNRISRSGKA